MIPSKLRKHGEKMKDRPFKILGVQQVAIGSKDKSKLNNLWVGLLGISVNDSHTSKDENVVEDICSFADDKLAGQIDLMEPFDVSRGPRVDNPALNHIGLWVDDIESAFNWLSSKGVNFAPGGIREGASGHRVCFLHPKPSQTHPLSGEGVLIELVEAPKEIVRHFKLQSEG